LRVHGQEQRPASVLQFFDHFIAKANLDRLFEEWVLTAAVADLISTGISRFPSSAAID